MGMTRSGGDNSWLARLGEDVALPCRSASAAIRRSHPTLQDKLGHGQRMKWWLKR